MFSAKLTNLKSLFSITFGRKAFFSFLDQGLFSGANFVLNILLARWLTPDQYGAYSVAFSIFLLLAGFQTAIFLEPMAIFGPTRHLEHLREYIGKITIYQFIFSTLLGTFLAIGALFFPLPIRSSLIGLAISIPFILLYWLMRQACYIESHTEMAASGSIIYALCLIIGAILFNRNGWLTPLSSFCLMGGCGLISYIFLFRLLNVKIRLSFSLPFFNENWKYGKWIIIASIAAWIIVWIYPPLISAFAGLAQAGAFRAMQNLILPLFQGFAAISLFLLPLLSRLYEEKGIITLFRTSWLFVGIGLLIAGIYTILMIFYGSWIVDAIYISQNYKESIWMLPYFGLSIILIVPGQFLGLSFRALGHSSYIFWIKAVSAMTILSIGILAIISKGITGVLFCLVLGSLVELLVSIFYIRKIMRNPIYNENIKYS